MILFSWLKTLFWALYEKHAKIKLNKIELTERSHFKHICKIVKLYSLSFEILSLTHFYIILNNKFLFAIS